MLLSYTDFYGFDEIVFKQTELMTIESFSKALENILKSKSSICLRTPGIRKIVENDNFWKSAGILLAEYSELEKIL